MTSDLDRRRELLRRLDDANARVRVQQDVLAGANTVIRVRLTMHVQSVTELLTDLDARSIDLRAAARTDARAAAAQASVLRSEIGPWTRTRPRRGVG